jgi:ribosomal protein S3AE
MAKKRVARQSVKKKKWFPIVSPKLLGEKPIGETYLEEPELAVGKTIKINLMQVTGEIKAQNVNSKYEIVEFRENVLRTKITDYTYLNSSLKRLVRRRMTKVDDSLVIMTKDDVKVRIKPLVLTRGKVSKSLESAFRAAVRKLVIEAVGKKTYEELFADVIKNRLQIEIKNSIMKLSPIKTVIIRVLKEERNPDVVLSALPKKVPDLKKEEKDKKSKEPEVKDEKTEPKKEVKEVKVTEEKPVKKEAKEEKSVEEKSVKKETKEEKPVEEPVKKESREEKPSEEKPSEKPVKKETKEEKPKVSKKE